MSVVYLVREVIPDRFLAPLLTQSRYHSLAYEHARDTTVLW